MDRVAGTQSERWVGPPRRDRAFRRVGSGHSRRLVERLRTSPAGPAMSLTRRQLLASTVAASVTGIVAGQAPAADVLAATADPSGHDRPPAVDLETATVAQLNAL